MDLRNISSKFEKNKKFSKRLKFLRDSQFWSKKKIKEYQLKELKKFILELKNDNESDENIIIGGDFNLPQWSSLINNTFKEYNICNDDKLTYPSSKPIMKLDYFITNYENYTYKVLDSNLSDHKAISLNIN